MDRKILSNTTMASLPDAAPDEYFTTAALILQQGKAQQALQKIREKLYPIKLTNAEKIAIESAKSQLLAANSKLAATAMKKARSRMKADRRDVLLSADVMAIATAHLDDLLPPTLHQP